MKCANCGKSTKNPKFCSRQCSAIVTNKLYPKRISKTWHCVKCGEKCGFRRQYCQYCNPQHVDWSKLTIGEVAGKTRYHKGATIRQLARKNFIASGLEMACVVCGYTNHVEICHIKQIKDFPSSAFVTEVNNPGNLLPLCPNHHWELDKNLLKTKDCV